MITVVGNGSSRTLINLNELQGRTFACNAAYRDFTPTDLVFIDAKMSQEIYAADPKCQVWTRINLVRENKSNWRALPDVLLSSGTTALKLASQYEPQEIHIYGMDMDFTNVYAGTPNYHQIPNHNPTPWINEFAGIIDHNPWIKYIRFKSFLGPSFNFGANYEERIL